MSQTWSLDGFVGPVGTPARDRFDRRFKRTQRASRIAHAVTRPWRMVPGIGTPIATFWETPIHDETIRPRAWVDAMAFDFLGDFLFWGKPMTETYFESRYVALAIRLWDATIGRLR